MLVDGETTCKYFKNAPKTLGAWYRMSQKFKNDEFLVFTGKPNVPSTRWTFAQVHLKAEALADMLKARGIRKGDRVSILMSNVPEYAVAFMGITKIGAIAVTLNAFWQGEELEFGLKNSGTCLLLVDERRLLRLIPEGRLEWFLRNGLSICVVQPSDELVKQFPHGILNVFEDWCKTDRTEPRFDVGDLDVGPEDDCYIMYTSGTTTGVAKGVVHTHRSSVQAVMAYAVFVEVLKVLSGPAKMQRADLVVSPMFHSAALIPSFLLAFYGGHKIVMIPKWDVETALKTCIDEKITFLGLMPTMLSDVLAAPYFQQNREKFTFTNIGTGGAATPCDLIRRAAKALPTLTQGSGWGMTETNSIGTINGGPEYIEFPQSCGKPHPIAEVKLIDPETNREILENDKAGEMYIKTVCNMRGYWQNEIETKATLLPGNWIRTGDLGKRDADGFYFVVDRIKDIVTRGGEKISCAEIENCVHSLPPGERIFEVSAFGLPHPRLGEQLAVAVVLRPGDNVQSQEIIDYCSKHLAYFKVPSMVFIRKQPLPRGATGKIIKRLLREEYKNV